MSHRVDSDPQPCDIVAFAAHPDDAELSCGGTLALAVEMGWKAAVVDFTRGELSTRGTPEERAAETHEAARALGLSSRVNLGLPDGHLEDNHESRKAVVAVLRMMRPRVVLAPPLDDHHADHTAAATIVSRSFHLSGVEKYSPGIPPWRPHALLHWLGSRAAIPQLVVDITRVFEKRMAAVRCYRSQIHKRGSEERPTRVSHPDYLEWIQGNLRHYGFLIGRQYGEAFTSPEPVPVLDPVAQYASMPWEDPQT